MYSRLDAQLKKAVKAAEPPHRRSALLRRRQGCRAEAIFQGIGCGGTVVACNDDFCSFQSTITPNVTAGTTYTIVVDGYDSGESGAFTLTVTPAP